MYFVPLRHPVLVESYETFEGPNPWANNTSAHWTVGGFRWGSKRPHDPAATERARSQGKRPRGIWAGVQSVDAKVLRIFPDALQDLWWRQKIAARDVPWLLHELAPKPVDGGGVVVRPRGSEQVDTKRPLFDVNSIIFSLIWGLCALVVIVAVATGFRDFMRELGFVSWIAVIIFAVPPAFYVSGLRDRRRETRRLKERALTLLQQRAAAAG